MPFPPEERRALLALKGVGPTVVARLVGSSCWKNSPQARAAIQACIDLGRTWGRAEAPSPCRLTG